ncbi:MAG: hypothetical protein ACYCQK_08595 [Acidiferrobacteraceae bacterium]
MNILKPRTMQALFAALSMAIPVAAVASFNPLAGLESCHEVSDHTLSHMRGRYIAFGRVAYFGVEMDTQWTTVAGAVIHSGADIQVDLSHGAPKIGYSTSTSIQNPNNAHPNGPTPAGTPLTTGEGVVQTIQVSSDGNTASNDVQVAVTDQAPNPTLGAGLKSSTTVANGMSAQASIQKDGSLVTDVMVPGAGEVRQVITGSSIAKGLFQNVILSGPSNQVQNNLMITLGVSPLSGTKTGTVPTAPLRNIMGTLMGVPRIGG